MKQINADLLLYRICAIQEDMVQSINDSAKAKQMDNVMINAGRLQGVCTVKALVEEMANE